MRAHSLCVTLTLALASALRLPSGVGRRTAIFGAAACSTLAWPSMAPAEDIVTDTASVLERARQNRLTVERVVQRARTGKLLKPGSAEGISCSDYYAVRAIDDKALSTLNKEIKAYKKVEKELIASGDPDVATFFADKAGETTRMTQEIQEAMQAIRVAEQGLCTGEGS